MGIYSNLYGFPNIVTLNHKPLNPKPLTQVSSLSVVACTSRHAESHSAGASSVRPKVQVDHIELTGRKLQKSIETLVLQARMVSTMGRKNQPHPPCFTGNKASLAAVIHHDASTPGMLFSMVFFCQAVLRRAWLGSVRHEAESQGSVHNLNPEA